MSSYESWMTLALEQAQQATAMGEVPVGAIVVHQDSVIAQAHNLRESQNNPLAHAEILAIQIAARVLGRWRLTDCTLVVTLEPCPMCAGAIVNARLDRLVFAATDPKAGAVGSVMNIVEDPRFNHRAEVVGGIMAEKSAALLRHFFACRRV